MTAFTSEFSLPYPQSTDDVQLWTDFQLLAEAVETVLNLPDRVEASISAQTVITSTSFAAIPTTPVSLSITNPSSVFDLEVDLTAGAWMAASANDVRAGIAASGGMSFSPTAFGSGGGLSFGDIMIVSSSASTGQRISYPVTIPAGAAAVTFALQAMRSSATGTQNVNYATLRATPRRFKKP